MTHYAINIESTAAFEKLLEAAGSKPVLADFYASWCPPCMHFKPVFEAMAKQYEGKAIFVKIDVDVQTQLSERYEIEAMPTFICFKNSVAKGDPV